ncbi:DUF4177 domain-containing protein [Roseovarius ramblicola]|uniref:DUF4177 domain-containing protein n=1 Tax=Roseovarius ramblicola TaxID=2022336 RepID=A0ABV5I0I0_9RHOB
MAGYEYRVLPAPTRGRKAPGVRTPEDRFALGIEDLLNEMARDGWRYLRSDILPGEQRRGLASTATVYRSVLVFERALVPATPPASGPTPEVVAEDVARSLTPDRPED